MRTLDQIREGKFHIKMLNIGSTGTGKTYLAGTFPKTYFLTCEPGGMDTIFTEPKLATNLVGWDDFIPKSAQDTKRAFIELNQKSIEARKLAEEGKVETIVLDNMTYLSENRWLYICTYEEETSPRTGRVDTQSMYGKLSRWLYRFTLMNLLTFPGNVVVNCHEMLESDEALDKKPDKDTPVLASILGGFRDKIGGMFSCVFFLSKVKGNDKRYHYMARTQRGNQRNAKCRFSLPEIIEDVSYDKLIKAINESLNKQPSGGGE